MPLVFLFTGEQGTAYGYHDGPQPDGTFWYTGEGQIGDMTMVRGNKAIRDHVQEHKALHLFEYVGTGRVRYVGEAVCVDHHLEVAPDREGTPRQAIVFELSLTEGDQASGVAGDVSDPVPRREERRWWTMSLVALRSVAAEDKGGAGTVTERKMRVYERSEAVRVYALRRANGRCEGCRSAAPFVRKDGRPYLEPHHIRRRADGGPDHPRWVAALCPNCHRRVHSGQDGKTFNRAIADYLGKMEAEES